MTTAPRVYADFQNVDEKGRLRLNCNGTASDLKNNNLVLYEGLELRLCMEDVEAIGTVTFSRDEGLWVAVIDWDAIGERSALTDRLPDNAFVVRGGRHDPDVIGRCVAVHPWGVRGISVVSAASTTLEELSATIPHRVISTTTVGAIRQFGGDVVSTCGRSPFHATLLIDDTQTTEPIIANLSRSHGVRRVFADFNNTTRSGHVRLNTHGSRSDLQSMNLKLHEGLILELYDLGEFEVAATVRSAQNEGWVAEVDWRDLD